MTQHTVRVRPKIRLDGTPKHHHTWKWYFVVFLPSCAQWRVASAVLNSNILFIFYLYSIYFNGFRLKTLIKTRDLRPRRRLNLLFSIFVTVPGGTFLLITRGVIDLIFLILRRLSRWCGLLPRGTLQNGHNFVPEYFNLQFLHAINLDDLDICILYQNKIIVQHKPK